MQFTCSICWALIATTMSLPPVLGDGPDKNLRSHYYFEDGGGIFYEWRDSPKGPYIVSIGYSGTPKWLVEQKDPRSHWHKIPTLEKIDLIQVHDLTPKAIEYIASLKSVRTLDIDETLFYRNAFAPLEKMTWLKSLSINCNAQHGRLSSTSHDLTPYERPYGHCFKFLEKLSELEFLNLWPDCDEATYIRICGLKQLKTLYVGDIAKLDDKNATKIRNLSNLEVFASESVKSGIKPILNGLSKNLNMRKLFFDCKSLDTNDVENIASMKNLQYITIKGDQIGSLTSLGDLKDLRKLELTFKEVGASDKCAFVKNMPRLERLGIHRISKGDFSIANLQGHKAIKSITINAVLNEDDLMVLESMSQLEFLCVSNLVDSEWMKKASRRLPGVEIVGTDSNR
jgi:hypothetical protein